MFTACKWWLPIWEDHHWHLILILLYTCRSFSSEMRLQGVVQCHFSLKEVIRRLQDVYIRYFHNFNKNVLNAELGYSIRYQRMGLRYKSSNISKSISSIQMHANFAETGPAHSIRYTVPNPNKFHELLQIDSLIAGLVLDTFNILLLFFSPQYRRDLFYYATLS